MAGLAVIQYLLHIETGVPPCHPGLARFHNAPTSLRLTFYAGLLQGTGAGHLPPDGRGASQSPDTLVTPEPTSSPGSNGSGGSGWWQRWSPGYDQAGLSIPAKVELHAAVPLLPLPGLLRLPITFSSALLRWRRRRTDAGCRNVPSLSFSPCSARCSLMVSTPCPGVTSRQVRGVGGGGLSGTLLRPIPVKRPTLSPHQAYPPSLAR